MAAEITQGFERVRPTGDRVREAWLSIVNPLLAGARVLDLFSGSGALGLEALSRGAEVVDFVENSTTSLYALRANVESLGAGPAAVVHRADAFQFIDGLDARAYDVAFADPPYDLGLASAVAERWLAKPFADVLGVGTRRGDAAPGEQRRVRDDDHVLSCRERIPGALPLCILRSATGGPALTPAKKETDPSLARLRCASRGWFWLCWLLE
jgi:16S rRNA (guanine966-N2)-methyltransferase